MSQVTDIILITGIDDGGREDCHPNVNILTTETDVGFVKVSDTTGGNKHMQADIFLSAMNYLDKDNFINIYRSIDWEYPECVQLYLKREYDDIFESIPLLITQTKRRHNENN